MARIRTIKPEFPQSETVGALSRDARLLFIQLWTASDDAGRLRGASRLLASLLYPYDTDALGLIDGWLDELADKGCIRRYQVDGNQYLEIVNWLEHQKIDRPSPSRLPSFDDCSDIPREDSRALDADLGPRTSTKDQGPRTVGASEDAPAKPKRATAFPKDFVLDDERLAIADRHGIPAARAQGVFDHFREHHIARGTTFKDWEAAWSTWCRNDKKFNGRPPIGGQNGTATRKDEWIAAQRAAGEYGRSGDPDAHAVSEGWPQSSG